MSGAASKNIDSKPSKAKPPRRVIGVSAIRGAAVSAQQSRLPQMAAALSYRTVFSLIPVLIISLVALRIFATEDDIAEAIARSLEYAGLADIAVSDDAMASEGLWFGPPMGPPAPAGPPSTPIEAAPELAGGEVAGEGEGEAPISGRSGRLDRWIGDRVAAISRIPLGAIGLLGLATLIYAAVSMLVEVERAFNQIYRVTAGRSWIRRLTQYWTLLTLGGLFLFATFYVGERGKTMVYELAESRGLTLGGAIGLASVGFGITVLISTLLLMLAYMAVPNTRVKPLPALCGALVAAALWEAGKWGFTQYLSYTTNYEKLYGSLALIPLFLLWVYITWIIVLMGLVVSYRLQHLRFGPPQVMEEERAEPVLVDPACILGLLAALAERFRQGKAAELTELERLVGVRRPILNAMLDRLVSASLLHRVVGPSGQAAFALAKPADEIRVSDALDLGHDMAAAGNDEASHGLVGRLRAAQREAANSMTIAQLTHGREDGPDARAIESRMREG